MKYWGMGYTVQSGCCQACDWSSHYDFNACKGSLNRPRNRNSLQVWLDHKCLKQCFQAFLSDHKGVGCDHFPWYIGPHCKGLSWPCLQTWDLTGQDRPPPPPPTSRSPLHKRHLVAITGDLFKLVHLRSPTSTDIWWPPKHVPLASGWAGTHPAWMLSCWRYIFSRSLGRRRKGLRRFVPQTYSLLYNNHLFWKWNPLVTTGAQLRSITPPTA